MLKQEIPVEMCVLRVISLSKLSQQIFISDAFVNFKFLKGGGPPDVGPTWCRVLEALGGPRGVVGTLVFFGKNKQLKCLKKNKKKMTPQ